MATHPEHTGGLGTPSVAVRTEKHTGPLCQKVAKEPKGFGWSINSICCGGATACKSARRLLRNNIWPLFTKMQAACAPLSNQEPPGYFSSQFRCHCSASVGCKKFSRISLSILPFSVFLSPPASDPLLPTPVLPPSFYCLLLFHFLSLFSLPPSCSLGCLTILPKTTVQTPKLADTKKQSKQVWKKFSVKANSLKGGKKSQGKRHSSI